jgi:DNA-binding Lrp family transcriptional regulator
MEQNRIEMNVPYFQVPNGIFEIGLSTQEIVVYCYLARCSNQGTNAFPSYNTIAKRTGMSRSTAIRVVAELEELKLIRKIVRKSDTKTENYSNIYVVEHDIRGSVRDTPPSVTDTPGSVRETPYKELSIKEPINKKYYIHQQADDYLKEYDSLFQKKFNKHHMKVTDRQLDYINWAVGEIKLMYELSEFTAEVKQHFDELPKGNNGSIIAFLETSKRHFDVDTRQEQWFNI